VEGSFSTIRRLASLGENKVRSGRHLKRAPASHRSGCAWRDDRPGISPRCSGRPLLVYDREHRPSLTDRTASAHRARPPPSSCGRHRPPRWEGAVEPAASSPPIDTQLIQSLHPVTRPGRQRTRWKRHMS
jgi:hypothetical protein